LFTFHLNLHQLLTSGVASSFAVMYMQPLNDFHVTAAFKAWVFNIGRGVAAMAGKIDELVGHCRK
jgi:hypothetical protein